MLFHVFAQFDETHVARRDSALSLAEPTDQGAFGFAIKLVADGLRARQDEPL